MIDFNITRFCNLGKLKKGIAILCLTALLLSASSVPYFFWVEEQLHEQEVFAKIDVEMFKEGAEHEQTNCISLILAKKDQLPDGYTWEEEGREFSHKGMFYDIISLKKTSKGWELVAASDEEEAAIVANQHSSKKEQHHFKLSRIQLIYTSPAITQHAFYFNLIQRNYNVYTVSLFNRSLIIFSPPPEAV